MARTLLLVLLLGLAGCLFSEEERCHLVWAPEPEPPPLYPEPTACDPAMRPTAIRLQPPVVVAEEDDGALLVLDRADDPLSARLFRSDGQALQRSAVTVEDRREGEDLYLIFASEERSGLVRLPNALAVPPNIVPEETALVLTEVAASDTLAEAFEAGTPLAMRSECVAAGRDLRDLPQRNVVEYLAQDEQGWRILVVRPEVGWDVMSATLFYGPPDAVSQREVTGFARYRDGGNTFIVFDVEGQEARLHFVVGCNGPFTQDCQGTLELPGETRTVSIPQHDVPVPEGETYLCHDG